MHLKHLPFAEPQEHPLDRVIVVPAAIRKSEAASGDVVLYRTTEGHIAPARLVELAGGGCWLARDARHTRGLLYLDPESITSRLPHPDLVGEAA